MDVEVKAVNGMPLHKFLLISVLSGIAGFISVGALSALVAPKSLGGLL